MFKGFSLFIFLTAICIGCIEVSESLLQEGETPVAVAKENIRIKTVHGDIVFELLSQDSPVTVQRVKTLTREGFYNGLSFHKVIPNFIIQTGDPLGSGEGGSGQKLKLEKSQISQSRGTVSMARQLSDPNSGDSQFFICIDRCHEITDKYTIFGRVTSGLEVAEKIQKNDRIINMDVE